MSKPEKCPVCGLWYLDLEDHIAKEHSETAPIRPEKGVRTEDTLSWSALRSKLGQALRDEQKAESFYRDLRRIAIDVRRKDFVDTITEIQQDEADHYKKVNEILEKMRSS